MGGRFYERFKDGDEFVVGRVTACERPNQIVFTWESPDWTAPTEVAVQFTAEADGTRVDLTHSGFEAAGAEAMGRAFDGGWDEVLSYFAKEAA